MSSAHITMPERARALLFLNGLLLFCFAVFVGWQWFFALLGRIELWPLVPPIDVKLPDDHRAWRMVHMEAITQGLMLMALGLGGRFVQLSTRQHRLLFWSALITAWLFTVPTWFHALFGTRGLSFGGIRSSRGSPMPYFISSAGRRSLRYT